VAVPEREPDPKCRSSAPRIAPLARARSSCPRAASSGGGTWLPAKPPLLEGSRSAGPLITDQA